MCVTFLFFLYFLNNCVVIKVICIPHLFNLCIVQRKCKGKHKHEPKTFIKSSKKKKENILLAQVLHKSSQFREIFNNWYILSSMFSISPFLQRFFLYLFSYATSFAFIKQHTCHEVHTANNTIVIKAIFFVITSLFPWHTYQVLYFSVTFWDIKELKWDIWYVISLEYTKLYTIRRWKNIARRSVYV